MLLYFYFPNHALASNENKIKIYFLPELTGKHIMK